MTNKIKYFFSSFLLSFILVSPLTLAETTVDKPVTPEAAPTSKDAKGLTDLRKPIIVEQAKPTFSIRLAANPTTGYLWYLTECDRDVLRPISYRYIAPQGSKLLGAPGMSEWTFQVRFNAFTVPRLLHVGFEYRRPWEANFATRQAITILTQPTENVSKGGSAAK